MTAQPNVRIWWDTSVKAYRMSSSFNKDLIEGIKQFIPVSDRSYDPNTKIWTFVEKQLTPLTTVFKALNVQAVIITRQQAEAAASASHNTNTGVGGNGRGRPLDVVIVEFLRLLPYDAAQAAYRKASLQLHPDRAGGSSDKMAALNTAWDRIQKEVYGHE